MLEREFSGWNNLKVIYNNENVGLAQANNQPRARVKGEYILILNPDTLISPKAIAEMALYLDNHPDVGVIGPKNLSLDGSPHRSFHRNWDWFHIALWFAAPYRLVRLFYDRLSTYSEQDVFFVSGACLLIRRELFIRLGGYDENFFLAIEDVADLCLRVRRLRYRVVFYPSVEVVHFCGRSWKDPSVKPFVFLKTTQGHLYYLRKYGGPFGFWSFYFLTLQICLVKLAVYGLASLMHVGHFKSRFMVHWFGIRELLKEPIPKYKMPAPAVRG
jgi:GT2 family glycosyltransferase